MSDPADPLRVLVLGHAHPDLSTGGAEIAAHGLYRELSERADVEAVFVAPDGRSPGSAPVLGMFSTDGGGLRIRVESERLRHSQRRTETLDTEFPQLLAWFRPDVVHFHHYLHYGVEPLRLVHRYDPSVPVVLTLHEFAAICHNDGQMIKRGTGELCVEASPEACHGCFPDIEPERFYLRDRYIKQHFAAVDRFLSPSRFLADRYVAWGLPAEKIEIVENIARVGAPATRRHDADGDGPVRLGFFGQIIPYKGLHVLLDALGRLVRARELTSADVTLDIHGSRLEQQTDEYRTRIETGIEELGDVVRLHGPYRNDEMTELLGTIDWVVMPSIWWENSPLVVQEAFGAGVPVLSAGRGGLGEKVTDGVTGLHHRPGDAADLAESIRRTLDTPDLRDRLAAAIPDPTPAAELAEAHLRIYREAADERAQRADRAVAIPIEPEASSVLPGTG